MNISVVHGELSEGQIKSMRSRGKDLTLSGKNSFFATGIAEELCIDVLLSFFRSSLILFYIFFICD